MSTQHTIRTRKGGTICIENYNKPKAIRAFCAECMGWESDPEDCTSTLCPLYPFRGNSRIDVPVALSDEERQRRADRLRKLRA